jgi:ribokinase
MKKDGVLVVGSANMDFVITTKRFPNPGETILGKYYKMFPGGKGANQAVSCAKLDAKTYFLGKIGNDDFSPQLKKMMLQEGVDLSLLMTDENVHTGTAFILIDDRGQNEIIVISGSNMSLTPNDVQYHSEIFNKVKVVLTQLEIPIETVYNTIKLAKEADAIVILNPAPARQISDEIYPLIDYLTPNESEIEHLSGIKITNNDSLLKASEVLLKRGTKNIIVTLGNKGALFVTENGTTEFPVEKVNVVDTTAAGDAFNGALAYSLNVGKSINDSISFANKVASISVTKLGAQTSMPHLKQITTS